MRGKVLHDFIVFLTYHHCALLLVGCIRQFHNGEFAKPSKSMRGYWERQDEYMDKGKSKVIGKDSARYPFCQAPERMTTSHTTHYPLHKQFPEVEHWG